MRSGIIAKKIGMSRIYSPFGEDVAVTLLTMKGCSVVSVKTQEKDGYSAVQVAFDAAKPKNVSKPLRGHFAKAKVEPKRQIKEFRVTPDNLLEIGQEIEAQHYVIGQYVDVVGITKGRGFSGGMRRHNFRGLEASHGVSVSHRSHGSTGNRQDPGRVFKGKKMAGHYGVERVTVQNLEVMYIDNENGVIGVCGSVPGFDGAYVYVKDAVKKALPAEAPRPAGVKTEAVTEQPSETPTETNEKEVNNE